MSGHCEQAGETAQDTGRDEEVTFIHELRLRHVFPSCPAGSTPASDTRSRFRKPGSLSRDRYRLFATGKSQVVAVSTASSDLGGRTAATLGVGSAGLGLAGL